MWRIVLASLVLVGCYRPGDDADCQIRCDPAAANPCQSGLTCVAGPASAPGARCSRTGGCASDDGGVDMPDMDPACQRFGLIGSYCPSVATEGTLTSGAQQWDTSTTCTETITREGKTLCVRAFEKLVIDGTIRIDGALPIVIFSRTTIEVSAMGMLDVAVGGAGASETRCTSASPPLPTAAGGAGGSYGSFGGAGGAQSPSGSLTTPGPLLGGDRISAGCPGGQGGGTSFGAGGTPGGAIYLVAGEAITIRGKVVAYGEGGKAAKASATAPHGGGGGGSGGAIYLDAPMISLEATAVLLAIGGGGGGGAGNTVSGSDGSEANILDPTVAAPPSTGVNNCGGCGAGGGGSTGTSNGGIGTSSTSGSGGGGGGGGGVGRIQITPQTVAPTIAVINPPPS